MKKIIFLLIGFYFFQSCTDLTLRLPTARFESPESSGKLMSVGIKESISQDHLVTVVQDGSARPPVFSPVTIDINTESLFNLSLGLSRFIDAGFRTSLAGNEFLAKFQLLGEPVHEAISGNFSVAVTAGIGFSSVQNSGTQSYIFGPGNAKWNGTATYTAVDLAVIAGYRLSDYVLIYGGPFLTQYNARVKLHQDAITNTPLSPAADYDITQTGTSTGLNIDAQFNFSKSHNWSITIEEVYSNLAWTSALTTHDFTSGLMGAYQF